MGRSGVTKSEVFEVANQLIGEGLVPTIEQIRLRLGTGSNSTIAGFLREWKQLKNQTTVAEVADGLPAELTGLMQGLWQRLLTAADEKIHAVKEESAQIVEACQTEVKSLQALETSLREKLSQAESSLQLMSQEKLQLEQNLTETNQKIIALSEKQNGLQIQLAEKQQLIDELRRLHKQSQANLEHYREAARQERMQQEARFAEERQQLDYSVKELQHSLQVNRDEKLSLQKTCEQLNIEKNDVLKAYEMLRIDTEKLQRDFQVLQQAQDKTAHQLESSEKNYATLQTQFDNQSQNLVQLQTQFAVLAQQLSDAKSMNQELKDQNQLLAQEKWELIQEKAQLIGQTKQLESFMQLKNQMKEIM